MSIWILFFFVVTYESFKSNEHLHSDGWCLPGGSQIRIRLGKFFIEFKYVTSNSIAIKFKIWIFYWVNGSTFRRKKCFVFEINSSSHKSFLHLNGNDSIPNLRRTKRPSQTASIFGKMSLSTAFLILFKYINFYGYHWIVTKPILR